MKSAKRVCLNCENSEIIHDTRDVTYEYRGRQITIFKISGRFCNNCEEIEFDKGEGKRYADEIEFFSRLVDKEETAELAKNRKKLKLTQQEAARLTGGGPNAFSRYERGKAKPMLAVTNLFRVLGTHPEILDELGFERKDRVKT